MRRNEQAKGKEPVSAGSGLVGEKVWTSAGLQKGPSIFRSTGFFFFVRKIGVALQDTKLANVSGDCGDD